MHIDRSVSVLLSLHQRDRKMNNNSMSDNELIIITIDKYTDLQKIKKANGDHENRELDYQIKVTLAKLASLGVSVEDITIE